MFFSSHPVYSSMPDNILGCHNLTQKLTKILFTHIKHNLPSIVNECRDKLQEAKADLRDLGPALPESDGEKMQLIWGMILEFLKTYENQIKGKFDARTMAQQQKMNKQPGAPVMQGGARIKFQFYKLYSDLESFNASQEYSDMVIEKAMVQMEGVNISGFPSIDLFTYLLAPQLEKLKEPANELIGDVF